MKLKKAMKKYDIKVTNLQNPHYRIGERVIFRSSSSGNLWWGDSAGIHQFSESEAVYWLVEGAIPLSPMERACKKWPIERNGNFSPTYTLGERSVFQISENKPSKWANTIPGNNTTYTESEAVAYLLEGYKPKMPDVKVILEHVDVEKDKKITGIDKNVCLGFGPTQAQIVLDTIWRAGYRPTKDAPIG